MHTSARSLMMWLLLLALTSCTNTPKATEAQKPTETTAAVQAIQSTGLAFSSPLVELLNSSGVTILSVRDSVYASMFQSTNKAAWIETDQGVVDVVFFVDPAEANQIQVTQIPTEMAGRYLYKMQARAPTLAHDVTLDAAFPLYVTMHGGMFMVTSSAELDRTLKRILSAK